MAQSPLGATQSPAPTHTPAVAHLVVVRGPGAPGPFPVSDRAITRIGRAGREVSLPHVTVSPAHAEIRPEHGRFALVNHDPLIGTYLNGRPISAAELGDGDQITVGVFRLIFELRGVALPAQRAG